MLVASSKWQTNSIFFLFLQEKHAREEEERKKRIQLYVFVLRCVAYNFNAKQPNDMQKRHLKVSKEAHEKMKAKIEVSHMTCHRNLVLKKLFILNTYLHSLTLELTHIKHLSSISS